MQSTILNVDSWRLRMHTPSGPGPHPVILLLHGWTGDETSMWVFTGKFPQDALLLAPRGLHPAPMGGYSWHPLPAQGGWPTIDDFRPTVQALLELLTPAHFPEADFSNLRVAGFSQGAALTYSLALLHPERVRALAGLAGFMPEGAGAVIRERPLVDKEAFVAHGTQDDRVPVTRARLSVEQLQQAGAQVTYCEEDVGHKLSAGCFRGLEVFFNQGN